ncbi:hypothetical protein CDL15_Pgr025819 [Punica granatum]|nr:hypothetical protein CDL15_Pgr025819 [Punica granatum]
MDAALDAMGAMGFEEGVVKAAVKELLKLYTGKGWRFIEDDSYRVLIDKLLEEPEQPELLQVPEPTGPADYQNSQEGVHGEDGPLRQAYRPCYGWINEDEEEEAEPQIVELKPMSLEKFRKHCYHLMESPQLQKKRKSRWDVGPS